MLNKPVGHIFPSDNVQSLSPRQRMHLIYLAQAADEVPRILAKAVEAGGTLVKPATRTHWGIAGYFKDPDGHLFEVDFEEAWIFDDEHRLVVDQLNTPVD